MSIKKYLDNYAESEAQLCTSLTALATRKYQQTLIIPFYQESADTLNRWLRFCENNPQTLFIAVINRPDTDSDLSWFEALKRTIPATDKRSGHLHLHELENHSSLLWVDRCSELPIPTKEGVGLARKIGNDIACTLVSMNCISSNWLANTDADASLSANYFKTLNETQNPSQSVAALVLPFEHVGNGDALTHNATKHYEFTLDYYVEALRYAGSHYSFHTIGSIVVIDCHHYAKVRGFPKRAGAEDFYLLNKLAKTGLIKNLEKPFVKLQSRQSIRVPFGTGPAVKAISELNNPKDYSLYHPSSFDYLKAVLTLLDDAIELQTDNLDTLFNLGHVKQLMNHLALDKALLVKSVDNIKAAEAISRALGQSNHPKQQQQHLQHWFDGFKTLKYIHWLRDHALGTMTLKQLIAQPTLISTFNSAALCEKLIQLPD